MQFNKTINASKNLFFGTALKLYHIIVPFLMRTAMIYWMGVQYLGLDGLFTSILSVLNLAELGVGSAMVYSMYKPIANDDERTICALMRLYKIYYRIIGLIVLCGGLVICPFIPKLISGKVPDNLNIYILYLLNLFATVISYWLFAYKNCLIQAHQRSDIISKITLIAHTIRYTLQFVLLFVFRDYYYYLIVALITQVLINIFTAIVSNKMFPKYKAVGNLEKSLKDSINKKIRDLFTAKIGAVVVDSVDTIVISAFLGLAVLGIYQNYFYILTAITGLINIVMTSCMAGIGNSIVTDTKEKVFKDMKILTFIVVWIDGFCVSVLLSLYQPFMQIWAGKDNMFAFSAVICFCIYFFIKQINTLLNVYKDAGGIWHKDRFRPLATALTNLVMNLTMVQFWGIYGILLSTVLSMLFVGMPWILRDLFTELLPSKFLKKYVISLLKYSFVVLAVSISLYFLLSLIKIQGIFGLIIKFIIIFFVFNLVFIIVFCQSQEFKRVISITDKITHYKIKVLSKFY